MLPFALSWSWQLKSCTNILNNKNWRSNVWDMVSQLSPVYWSNAYDFHLCSYRTRLSPREALVANEVANPLTHNFSRKPILDLRGRLKSEPSCVPRLWRRLAGWGFVPSCDRGVVPCTPHFPGILRTSNHILPFGCFPNMKRSYLAGPLTVLSIYPAGLSHSSSSESCSKSSHPRDDIFSSWSVLK
jgi:hypothetical protein